MSLPMPVELEQLQQQCLQLQAQNDQLRQALRVHEASTLQRVFYSIAERATAGLPLYEFLKACHGLVGELLHARNFFVCLCNHQKSTCDFPYYEDERDGDTMQRSDVPHRRGLTEFVLRTGKAQIISAERFLALQRSGEVTEATGDLSFTSWLGVPMQVGGRISGVLVVQTYEKSDPYTSADADVLSYVSSHIGSAVERYRAIDDARRSEERYRSVVENVGVGVVVVQDGMMVFINPTMEIVVGHTQTYLLNHPFTKCIHPDDVPIVVKRHEKRLRGEPVEPTYGFRIVTAKGETRTLELSAVVIQWNQRDATLVFVMDATARHLAERTQRMAMQKQTELNDLKTRFITMASHEFRTPLAAIHGSVELLMHYEDRLPPDKKRQTLEKIDDAVDRMTHMLENVLQIGRTDAGQLQFRPKSLLLTNFCLGLIEELRNAMAAEFAHVLLILDLPPNDRKFELDEALMRNIVGNLISNAVKYSPQGGSVRIMVDEQQDAITLVVRDEGIGIPKDDLSRLFQSFYRATNVGSIAGTGLGLSIVKEAVTTHKGTIRVESVVNQGTCFTVMLPLTPHKT
jgi:PAS domain S-box-containing protein